MRKIKADDRIDRCVHIGEVIKYNPPGHGLYYNVVAVNKPQSDGCLGCVFNGCYCGVWFNGRSIPICCTDLNKPRTGPSTGKFCKFVRVDDLLEDL